MLSHAFCVDVESGTGERELQVPEPVKIPGFSDDARGHTSWSKSDNPTEISWVLGCKSLDDSHQGINMLNPGTVLVLLDVPGLATRNVGKPDPGCKKITPRILQPHVGGRTAGAARVLAVALGDDC